MALTLLLHLGFQWLLGHQMCLLWLPPLLPPLQLHFQLVLGQRVQLTLLQLHLVAECLFQYHLVLLTLTLLLHLGFQWLLGQVCLLWLPPLLPPLQLHFQLVVGQRVQLHLLQLHLEAECSL